MEIDWKKIREQFPAVDKRVYLNTVGGPPIAKSTSEASIKYYRESCEEGDVFWNSWLEQVSEVRVKVSKWLHADTREIAFIPSTSEGMNIIANILEGNGSVLTFGDEFPATTLPWIHHGYEVDFVDSREDNIVHFEDIENAITEKTKIVVFSTVKSPTGFRQDFDRIYKFCKEKGFIIVVDMTQCSTVFPVDLSKYDVDFLLCSCYKWTMAGYGLSILYINDKHLVPDKLPSAGWMSVKDTGWENRQLLYKNEASVLEGGCPNFAAIFALGASLEMLMDIGTENIQTRLMALTQYTVEKLKEIDVKILSPQEDWCSSPILLLDVGNNVKRVVSQLFDEHDVFASAKPIGMRVSLNIYNNFEDVDRLIEALKVVLINNANE